MSLIIFQTELNDFCQNTLITNNGKPSQSPQKFISDFNKIKASLFEQFLLFDSVSFKVHGENIPLIMLLNNFGLKGVEELLEQDAIKFVLWNQMITYVVDDIPGLDPLQQGTYNSKAHFDPEESITLGFNWMEKKLKTSEKKNLIKKVRDKYKLPNASLSGNALSIVTSAYNTGKLEPYNLSNKKCELRDLDVKGRKELCRRAEEVLQYSHLIKEKMSSYNKYEYFKMFNDTNKKVYSAIDKQRDYNALSEIENIPDLQSLYPEINDPFKKLIKIRNKSISRKFRAWLDECNTSSNNLEITKEYIDAIADSKGFFQTKTGRFSKNIAMSTIGAGVGAMIAGPIGALTGASAAKILEPAADFGLDLLDEFVLTGLTQGWTPKMFFNDIEKLKKSNN